MPDKVPDRPSQDEETEDQHTLERVHQIERRPVQLIGTDPPGDQLHHPVQTHQEEQHQADEEGPLEPAEELLLHPIGILVPCQTSQRELLLILVDVDGRDHEEDHVG